MFTSRTLHAAALVLALQSASFSLQAAEAPMQAGATAMKPASLPRQAWAHRDGRANLLPQGAAVDSGDLMSRLMIQEAFARFGIAYDEGRSDVLASLFTDGALLEIADGQGVPFDEKVGAAVIARHFASALAQQGDQRRHLISNVVIERLTAAEASALAYGVVTVAANGLYLGASVFYAADLKRGADGAWRFSHFFIGIDTYVGKKPRVGD